MSQRIAVPVVALAIGIAMSSCHQDGPEPVEARLPPVAEGASPPGYNVLLITLDTTRADRLGAYGYEKAHTPALDALAAGGALFERAYTSCPLTLPAHATLLTGMQPPQHGLRVNGGGRLGGGMPTLASTLRAEGYRTGAFVAAFVLDSKFGLDRGFEVYDDDLSQAHEQEIPEPFSVHRDGSAVVDAALEWLTGSEGAGSGVQGSAERAPANPQPTTGNQRPFFAWVHLYDPHYPYFVHEELAGTPYEDKTSYDGDIAFMDLQVKRLLDFLEQRGLSERTLVVAVADHGEGLEDHGEFEHGFLLNEEVLRVPLLVSLPGIVRAGHRVDAVVSMADLFPTILDVLGVELDEGGPGRSLRAALAGDAIESKPSYAESEMAYTIYGWSPLYSLTTPQWKYIRTTRPELYERPADTREIFNLASARPEEVAAIDSQLASLERRLGPAAKAEAVALSAKDRERMEALGYASNEQKAADQPPANGRQTPNASGLRDIKDMLATKHLDTNLFRGMVTGTLSPEQQVEMAQELVKRSPETASFQGRLGAAWLNAAKPEEAIAPLTEALRLEPVTVDFHVNLGRALARTNKTDEAIRHFREALAQAPDSVDAHFGVANTLADAGELDTACGHYAEVIRLQPDNAEAHFNLANTLARRRRTELAINEYREAVRLGPAFAAAHFNLANLLAANGKPEEAAAGYEEVLRLEPENVDALNNLGVALARLGRREEAKARYAQATKARPDFARPHFNLGLELAAEGKLAEAAASYAKAVELWPANPEFATTYARLLATSRELKLRNPQLAVELAEKAMASKSGDPRVLDTLALAYAAADQSAKAKEIGELALKLSRLEGLEDLATEIEARLVENRNGDVAAAGVFTAKVRQVDATPP